MPERAEVSGYQLCLRQPPASAERHTETMRMLVIAVSLWVGSAQAEYRIAGHGNVSCGEWQRHRKQPEGTLARAGVEAWVLGYVTRASYDEDANLGQGTDHEGLWAWVDNYCRNHPLDTLAVASEHLVDELQRRRRR
jgi:hypothetical protein